MTLIVRLPFLTLLSPCRTKVKGRTISIGYESQGLYHLSTTPSFIVCTSTDEPLLVHHRLDHPNISKLRKMVSRFSSLSSLECESCQLGKQTRVLFPKRLESRTKSPFDFSVGSSLAALVFSDGLQSSHINSIVEHLECRIAIDIR